LNRGAGKTTATLAVLDDCTDLADQPHKGAAAILEAVSYMKEMLPLIGLFTNAKTALNDSSTRCMTETKVRVVNDSPEELAESYRSPSTKPLIGSLASVWRYKVSN
jgi:hypothetical protein